MTMAKHRKNKRIAVVAHDNRKKDMAEWVAYNHKKLKKYQLVSTGTTGKMVEDTLNPYSQGEVSMEFPIILLKSGPLGGDQQLGAMISEGKIDIMIFFWDPMQPQPHDVDIKALLRITALYNIPTATNRSTADFIISSPLFEGHYEPIVKSYQDYIDRSVQALNQDNE